MVVFKVFILFLNKNQDLRTHAWLLDKIQKRHSAKRRPEGEGFYVLTYVHFIIDLNNMTRNQGGEIPANDNGVYLTVDMNVT